MDIMVMHGALSAGNKLYRTGSIVNVDDALGEELIKRNPEQFCQAVGKAEQGQDTATQPEAEPAKDTKAKDEPKAEKEVGLPSADPSAAVRK